MLCHKFPFRIYDKIFGSSRFSVGWALLCIDARTESHGFCKHHAHNAHKRTMLTSAPSSPHSPSSPRSPSPRKAHNPASAACNGASNGAAGYVFRHPSVTDARIQTVSERLESPERPDWQLQNRPLTSIPQLSVKNQIFPSTLRFQKTSIPDSIPSKRDDCSRKELVSCILCNSQPRHSLK